MRRGFVHEALLDLDGDPGGPGAAVTLALCGALDHRGACPLAPHHSRLEQGDPALLRIVFGCEPAQERAVRALIGEGLQVGRATGPDGRTVRWRLIRDGASDPSGSELVLAARLTAPAGAPPPR